MIKRLQGGVEGDDDYPQWFLVDKLNEVIDELNDLEERYAQHTGYPAELMHPKSPPKKEEKLYLTAEGMLAYDYKKKKWEDLRIESPRTEYEKGWNDALKAVEKVLKELAK